MIEVHAVRVSRKWNEPTIAVDIVPRENGVVAATMPLTDFLDSLVEELGNPAAIFTKAQLLARLTIAADAVVYGMKEEVPRAIKG